MAKIYDVVYVYTTDVKRLLNRAKIGKATRFAASPEEAAWIRIKEQFTAGNRDETVELLHVFDQTDEIYNAYKIESTLHTLLKFRNVGGEWFDIGSSDTLDMDLVYSAYNGFVYGSDRPNNFSARINQQNFVDKASEYYLTGGTRFLLAAIMRYGKCLSTYWLAKTLAEKMDFKRILVLSAKTDVRMAWYEDLQKQVGFEDWKWYDTTNSSKSNPLELNNDDKYQVIFLTLQDSKSYTKDKLKQIIGLEFDLVVVDETHFATETDKTDDLFKQLNYKFRLDMSGTAFNKLMSGEYTSENTYVYGLIEEVRDINNGVGGLTYKDLPKLNLYTVSLDLAKTKELDSFYNDEEGFKFSTLLAIKGKGDKAEFVNKVAVGKLIDILGSENPREYGGISPFNLDNLVGFLDNTVWFLPKRIGIVKAFAKMLKKHPFFQNHEIFVASGDNNGHTNEEILNLVKYNSEVKGKKTIVLSAGKFSTGVSMKKWYTVFNFTDTENAAEEYFQGLFRSKTPDKANGKDECFAVDFNPQRALVMQYKYALATAVYEKRDTVDLLKEFNEVLPVMNITSNKLVQHNISDILAAMQDDMDRTNTWTAAGLIVLNNIKDSMVDIIDSLDKADMDTIVAEISNNDDLRKGETVKSSDKREPANKIEDADVLKGLREKALSVTEYMPAYLELSNYNMLSVNDIIEYADKDLFRNVTGVDFTLLELMLNKKIINHVVFTRALEQHYLISTL